MFNLNKEVQRLQQLQHDKVYGLPFKGKHHNSEVSHIDGDILELQAIQEGMMIPRSFHNYSKGFGRRLCKAKGEKHFPGGYAG